MMSEPGMMPEPKLPKFIRDDSGELPPERYELTPEDLAAIEAAIENANAQLSLPYQRLFDYLNSAPPARGKERLQNIEGWRKEQRQQINEQRVDAAKIGTAKIGKGQRGEVADQKQRELSAHPENRKPVGRKPVGRKPASRKFADQEPGITTQSKNRRQSSA